MAVVAAVLPLTAAGGLPAAAEPVPPSYVADGTGALVQPHTIDWQAPRAERKPANQRIAGNLVPGVPLPADRWHTDTPDQALPPTAPDGRRAEAAPPKPPAADAGELVEFVPPSEARPDREVPPVSDCTRRTGPYQRQVERFLRLPVDGRQSVADCRRIRGWQLKEGVRPAIGFSGPTSWGRMRLAEAAAEPNAAGTCPVVPDRIACVDLPRQLMWVQKGRKVLFGPVPIRSGMAGYPTRVGWNRIYWRSKDHVSTIYKTRMPFAQFFNGGQAFHGVYGGIYDPRGGSHGCVNLRYAAAERLWSTLRMDDRVFSWGRRAGT